MKSRLNFCLEVFESVITLDSHHQEIKDAIENGNM